MISGIYRISNKLDTRCYIGSSKNIEKRFKEHVKGLKLGQHHNKHLLNFVDKYGLHVLKFDILEECDNNQLEEKENYYINLLNPEFNICKKAYRLPPPNRRFSHEELLNIIDLYNSGKSLCWIAENIFGDRMLRKILSNISRGLLYAEYASKFKIREYSQVGRKLSEKSKRKIGKGNSFKGKLSKQDVIDIKEKAKSGVKPKDLVKEYNVDRSVIYRIRHNQAYKHLNS